MKISFFEEFPTQQNLDKLKLVSWPTKIYVAAESVFEYKIVKSKINSSNVKKVVYWPTLKKKEGYWFSPFSRRGALKRALSEVKGKRIPVMIDLELPTRHNPFLFLSQSLFFPFNRRMIRKFIKDHSSVYTAEYYPQGRLMNGMLTLLGLRCNPNKYGNKSIKMLYHSLHKFNKDFITNQLKTGVGKYGKNYLVAYGTIMPGINGNEPLLDPKQLREDLKIAKEAGVSEVVMFGLGGLNKKYVDVMKKFV